MKNEAFGKPGLPPNWARASKQGVGTALSDASKVWFTIADGVITEVYYPSVDIANTKDIKFLITDSKTFFNEEGADTVSETTYIDHKAPAYIITNTARSGAYIIRKRVVTDPEGNSLLINVDFEVVKGAPQDYRLFVLFAPHIKNRGYENNGRCASYDGRGYLLARREDISAALTSDAPFLKMSAGFSGFSDGWQDLKHNLNMHWEFERAEGGNIALMAEVPAIREFNIVLSFGKDEVEAVLEANKTLARGYDRIEKEYIKGWKGYFKSLHSLEDISTDGGLRYWVSAMVLKTHEDKTRKGGIIASLSVPWGEAKGDRDAGGYHIVWPRDLVKAAFAFMAMGDIETAVNTLKFLRSTQYLDGSWPQNMWLDGRAHWGGVQIDEVAFPIILAWRLKKMGAVNDEFYPMVKKAASFILKHGPVTEQERWEENTGFSPSTLAAEITALVCAGNWAEETGDARDAAYILSSADYWAARLETWTFSECDCIGENIPGHYLRIVQEAPDTISPAEQVCHILVFIKNLPQNVVHHQGQIVDAGFLELVRFGVRGPHDIPVLSSLSVVDKIIRFEYTGGASFYRYNGDGYGEQEDGRPFDGSGIGRPWPLLTGERATYELIAGNNADHYIRSLEGFANEGLMFPEQIWDKEDIPEKKLFKGKGTGSATPLMWAHAEYIKILRTVKDGQGCDIIPEVKKRYVDERKTIRMSSWKKNKRVYIATTTDIIRIISFERAALRWTSDNWETVHDDEMAETGLGLYHVDFEPGTFRKEAVLIFTFHYTDTGQWEGKDYQLRIFEPSGVQTPAFAGA